MAASDATLFPKKNTAFRYYFPIYDNTGALVSGAAGLDSEVSIDGAAFADCTNEATEIGSSGTYFIDLTAGELNGDGVVLIVNTSTVDAKPSVAIFYPTVLSVAALGTNTVSMAADSITNTALAASAVTEIQSGLATAAALADVPTATENADALLNRDMSAVSDTNSRSPLNAIRFLRNKWDVAAGTLTVKKEDDSTTAWTATISSNPSAEPITGSDPS